MTTATPKPVAGPTFRAVAALPVDGVKRRRLLCLIAAYHDAGEPSPPVRELAARLKLSPVFVDVLLDLLVKDGWLQVTWANHGPPGRRQGRRRNRYELRLSSDARGEGAA